MKHPYLKYQRVSWTHTYKDGSTRQYEGLVLTQSHDGSILLLALMADGQPRYSPEDIRYTPRERQGANIQRLPRENWPPMVYHSHILPNEETP